MVGPAERNQQDEEDGAKSDVGDAEPATDAVVLAGVRGVTLGGQRHLAHDKRRSVGEMTNDKGQMTITSMRAANQHAIVICDL